MAKMKFKLKADVEQQAIHEQIANTPPAEDGSTVDVTGTVVAPTFTVRLAETDEYVTDANGAQVLVIAGGYIATDNDGHSFGINAADLELHYVKA